MRLLNNIFVSLARKLVIILVFIASTAIGQTHTEREVIGSSGGNSQTSTVDVSYSIGETVVTTGTSSSISLTQGFEQPIDFVGTVSFTVNVENASCVGKRNGRAFIGNIGGCQPPYQILWSAGTNPSDSSTTFGLPAGEYTVQVVSQDGCNEIVGFTIGVIDQNPCILTFYSGITPNNDGLNDSWIIDNIDVFPKNEVNIFNRLGNRVWQGVDYDNDNTLWKGQNLSGNDLPSDTYFYVFEANGEVEKGWIELTR